jgi:signal transduction histidine kinase
VTTAALPVPRPRRPWRGHLAATVAVLVASAVPRGPGTDLVWRAESLAVAGVGAALLLVRWRWPRQVLLAAVAVVAVSVPLGLFNPGSVVAVAVATYTLVLTVPRRTGVLLVAGTSTLMLVSALLAEAVVPQHVLVVVLGGVLGDAIRTQRAHLDALTDRAERAERTREALARQRVAEDRLSTARDLHDVVAHQIAVINLHAGVASSALRTRPDSAEASLALIRTASRTVLTEIGDLLAALRDPDAVDAGLPGLALLDDVLRDMAAHGLDVTVRTVAGPGDLGRGDAGRGDVGRREPEGPSGPDAPDLPAAVDAVALRVVQEALANAHKHGTGRRAHLLVEHLPRSVRITVTNPVGTAGSGPGGAGPSTGYGLLGTAERVGSVRGTLRQGRDGLGSWVLVADLPTAPRRDEEETA